MDIKQLKKDIEEVDGYMDNLFNVFGDLKNSRQKIRNHLSEIERLTELVKKYKKLYELHKKGVAVVNIEMRIKGMETPNRLPIPQEEPIEPIEMAVVYTKREKFDEDYFQDWDFNYYRTQEVLKTLLDCFEKEIEEHYACLSELKELFKHSSEKFSEVV